MGGIPAYFQRVQQQLQQGAGNNPVPSPLPDLGQPNPGQYGPPAPGSQNNPLRAPGFDLGQPNPGEYGPPAPGSQNNPAQPDLWSRLMNAVGNSGLGRGLPSMPGTTIGAPGGASGAMAPPAVPMLPQGQMPAPPGVPYFTQHPQGNQGNLMAQYLMLQQLMRGS